jgi:hypothetical protein
MGQGASGFYYCIPSLPQHVLANGCHLQGVIGAVEATRLMSVLWAYTDYDLSSVASCREMYLRCFGKWLPSSWGCRCLRSYSCSVCIVGIYGLRSIQCSQLSWNVSEIQSTITGCTGCIVIRLWPQYRPLLE